MILGKVVRNPQKVLPLSVFVTNVGNGMYTLAVSKVMYDMTGSTAAFASVLILENILIFLTQAVASITVDSGRAKQSAVLADMLRGTSVIISGILVVMGYPLAIYLGTVVINLMRPFYRTATFAIGPMVANGESLAKYNARTSGFQQVGQMVGAGVAGLLLTYVTPGFSIILNGFTYIFSSTCFAIAAIPNQSLFSKKGNGIYEVWTMIKPKKFCMDWYNLVKELIREKKLIWIIILCTVDFTVISYINMSYVPVLQRNSLSTWWLSFWDGSFAIGAIVGVTIFGYIKKLRRTLKWVSVALIIEGIMATCFVLFSPKLIAIGMFCIGIVNAFSVSSFSLALQTITPNKYHGRISGVRQLAISTISLVAVPIISFTLNKTIVYAALIILGMCFASAVTLFIIEHIKEKLTVVKELENV